LRNRVFHHEPTWHDLLLQDKYNEIVEIIRWINGDLVAMAHLLDRFPTVYANGLSLCQSQVSGLITP